MTLGYFTDEEVERVSIALGYFPGQMENDVVEIWLEQVSSEYRKDIIMDTVTSIEQIKISIQDLWGKLLVSQLDDITLQTHKAIAVYKSEGSRYVVNLSRLTNIPIYHDQFAQKPLYKIQN